MFAVAEEAKGRVVEWALLEGDLERDLLVDTFALPGAFVLAVVVVDEGFGEATEEGVNKKGDGFVAVVVVAVEVVEGEEEDWDGDGEDEEAPVVLVEREGDEDVVVDEDVDGITGLKVKAGRLPVLAVDEGVLEIGPVEVLVFTGVVDEGEEDVVVAGPVDIDKANAALISSSISSSSGKKSNGVVGTAEDEVDD